MQRGLGNNPTQPGRYLPASSNVRSKILASPLKPGVCRYNAHQRAWGHWAGRGSPESAQRQAVLVRAGDDQALATLSRLANRKSLDQAARRFLEGLKSGLEEDELVAMELGAPDVTQLTELQLQYKDKVKQKLLKRVEELKAEDAAMQRRMSRNYVLGKEAYAVGEYMAAVRLLEEAVEELGRNSVLGGEAQLWLAMSYQAVGREADCIELYKYVETSHPLPKIRKQAADLRYIVEAPKLEIGEDERVTIPLLNSQESWKRERKGSYNSRLPKPAPKKESSYWDKATWDLPPPNWMPDKWYVRVAWLVVIVGTTVWANMQLKP